MGIQVKSPLRPPPLDISHEISSEEPLETPPLEVSDEISSEEPLEAPLPAADHFSRECLRLLRLTKQLYKEIEKVRAGKAVRRVGRGQKRARQDEEDERNSKRLRVTDSIL